MPNFAALPTHRAVGSAGRASTCATGRSRPSLGAHGIARARGADPGHAQRRAAAARAARAAGRSASTPAGRPPTAASTSATRGRTSSSRCCGASSPTRATSRRSSSTSPTSTTRSTTRPARPGEPSAELAARDDRAPTSRTPTALGLGRPDAEPLATETIAEIVALIEALIECGHAYEADGDVYFRVRSFDGYGKLSNRDPEEMDQGEEAGTGAAQGGPARLRALEGAQGRRGHRLGLALGRGAARLAHRVLGDGREAARPRLRDPRRRLDLVFPHHENEIAQTEAARGEPLARIWMHNGMVQIADEKMSKSVGNIFQLSEALDRYGARGGGRLSSSPATTASRSRSPRRRSSEAAARVERIRNYLAGADRAEASPTRSSPSAARRSSTRSPTTSTRRARSPRSSSWSPRATAASCPAPARRWRSCCRCSGSSRCSRAEEPADAEAERLLAEREQARAERDFERADEIRDELAELGWEVRDTAGGRAARAPERSMATEIVYGRTPGRRGQARAAAGAPRLDAPTTPPPRSSTRLAGSPDHQGVVAEVDPYPVRRPGGAARRRRTALVVALDQVQDPHNLGAVCRSAEAAGAPAS